MRRRTASSCSSSLSQGIGSAQIIPVERELRLGAAMLLCGRQPIDFGASKCYSGPTTLGSVGPYATMVVLRHCVVSANLLGLVCHWPSNNRQSYL